jgi:hypothetical protein
MGKENTGMWLFFSQKKQTASLLLCEIQKTCGEESNFSTTKFKFIG